MSPPNDRSTVAPPTVPTPTAPPERSPVPQDAPQPPSADRATRVAVVGAGFIADFHLEILQGTPGVELVAVCDPAPGAAERAARRWKVPHAVASVAELAPLGVQLAHVLVPPHLHLSVARELIELGIGAFVEKPLALSSADARELCELARERGVVLGVNHNALYHPAFLKLLERVERGEVGRVEHVRVTLSVPLRQLDAGDFSHWMFRTPRNIVFEQAPHPLAQLERLVGPVREATTTILGTRELQPGQLFHDRWLTAARAERGTAEVHLAFGQSFTRSTLEVLGTDGALEADLFHDLVAGERKTPWLEFWNSFLAGWRRGGELRRSARRGLADYLKLTLGLAPRQDAFFAGMRGSIRAFYAALHAASGGPAAPAPPVPPVPRVPPVDGLAGVRVLDWCEALTADVSGRETTAEDLFTERPARPGEVVVLGGTGFIGRRVVEGLLARGLPVTAVVRRAHSLPPRLTEAARDGRVRLLRASLEDAAGLARAVEGARCVLQLATGGGGTWEAIERSMVGGSVALAEACLEHGVERLVYVSSSAALYLGADAGSLVEDSVGTDPRPEGRALYARGKIAAEAALMKLHRERGLPLVITRPAVVLGEGSAMQHSGLGLWVRDNHCVGWGPGDTPLPLVSADDVAEAHVRLVEHAGSDLHGRALNLSANPGLSAREVLAELRAATGRDLHFHGRSLLVSQAMEIGKWIVKKVGRRPGAQFPSWRDLKSRALVPELSSRTAREVLGWKPVEEREAFLDLCVRVHGRPRPGPGEPGPPSGPAR